MILDRSTFEDYEEQEFFRLRNRFSRD